VSSRSSRSKSCVKELPLPRGKDRFNQDGSRRRESRAGVSGGESASRPGSERISGGLSAERRMVEKDRRVGELEAGDEILQEPLAHQRGPQRTAPFAFQRGHRSVVWPAAAHQAK